jgi:hypothetical protein
MVGLCPVFQFSGWTPVRTWAEQASWAVSYSRFSNEINLVELLHRVYYIMRRKIMKTVQTVVLVALVIVGFTRA